MIRITGEAQKNAHHVFSRRLMCCCVDIDKSSFNNAAAKEFRPSKFRTFFFSFSPHEGTFFHWSCFSPRLDPDHKSFSLQIESDHVRCEWAALESEEDSKFAAYHNHDENVSN
jgi:Fe-S-cluster containining protein